MFKSLKAPLAFTAIIALACTACDPSSNKNEPGGSQQPPAATAAPVTASADAGDYRGLVPFDDVTAPAITKSVNVKIFES